MEDFISGLIAVLLVGGFGYFIYTRIQKSKKRKSGIHLSGPHGGSQGGTGVDTTPPRPKTPTSPPTPPRPNRKR